MLSAEGIESRNNHPFSRNWHANWVFMTTEQLLPLAGQMVVQVCVSCFLTHLHICQMGESSILVKHIVHLFFVFQVPKLVITDDWILLGIMVPLYRILIFSVTFIAWTYWPPLYIKGIPSFGVHMLSHFTLITTFIKYLFNPCNCTLQTTHSNRYISQTAHYYLTSIILFF